MSKMMILVLGAVLMCGCIKPVTPQEWQDVLMQQANLQAEIIEQDMKGGMTAREAAADAQHYDVIGDSERFRQQLEQERVQWDLEKYLESHTNY